jgi:Flp pilus assembly pilin Flp
MSQGLCAWLQTKFSHDERGASMVEYILLVARIALAVIAAVVFLRSQMQDKFRDAGSKLSNSGTEPHRRTSLDETPPPDGVSSLQKRTSS